MATLAATVKSAVLPSTKTWLMMLSLAASSDPNADPKHSDNAGQRWQVLPDGVQKAGSLSSTDWRKGEKNRLRQARTKQ